MVRNKLISIIVVVLAQAGSLYGQNFRAGDTIYFPAGHLISSTTFVSDVYITNCSTDPVIIHVGFAPGNVANPPITWIRNAIHLTSGQTQEYDDFLPSVLKLPSGMGLVVLSSCKEGADCDKDPSQRRLISAETRIYSFTKLGGPTVGQDFAGIPWRSTANPDIYSDSHGMNAPFIVGIKVSDQYRTNLGLINASEFESCTLTATLFDGTDGGKRDDYKIDLGPLGNVQLNVLQAFPKLAEWSRLNRNKPVTNAVIVITQSNVVPVSDAAQFDCADGCPGFIAYASVIDNTTNDATTLEAQYKRELRP